MSALLNISSVPLASLQPAPRFGSVCCLLPPLSGLGDVDAVEVVGAEGTVALGALPLSGVVTHLETFVAEHVEALGEHRFLVSGVAAGAAKLGLHTHMHGPNHDWTIPFVFSTLSFPERQIGVLICTFLACFTGRLNSHTPLPESQARYKDVVFCMMTCYVFTRLLQPC